MEFTRITVHPDVMGGTPCIRGMRVPVVTVVAMVADGMTTEEILGGETTTHPRRAQRTEGEAVT